MVLTETQKSAIAQAFTDYLLEKIYEEQSY
jgi:hypothetical protein